MKNLNWQLLNIVLFFLASYILIVVAIIRIPLNKRKSLPQIVSKYVVSFTITSTNQIKKISLFSKIASVLIGERNEKWIRENLLRIGKTAEDEYSKVTKRKFLFGILLLGASILYVKTPSQIPIVLIGTAFGFYLPELLIYNETQKINEQIQSTLPEAVDMLSMCVDTGLSFQQSLRKVSDNQDTLISKEFARILSEIELGTSRSEALTNMAQRLKADDINRFVTALIQVDRLGIPISSVLKEQVAEMRAKNRERAREQAQKVPVKILGPIMLCFLPCVLIIVLGPTILSLMESLSGL